MIEMATQLDLRPDHWDIVCAILNKHVPNREVLAFGSRATWTANEYSDLDLAILGDEPLLFNVTSALTEGFSESDLPFKVDVVEWARIDETLREKINREGLIVKALTRKAASEDWQNLPPRNHQELPTKKTKAQQESTDTANNIGDSESSDSLLFGDCAKLIKQSIDPVGLAESTPYVGLEHILQEQLQLSSIGNSTDIVSIKQIFQRGDILFGKLRPYFRKVIYANFDGICSTDIWVIRPKEEFNSKFIFYWCSSWDFVNYVNSSAEGTRMPRAKWEIACNHHVPKFTPAEQNAIAHILGTLDEKIELNRRMNETLEDIAQILFDSWFVKFDPVRAKMEGKDTGLPKHIDDLFPDRLVDSELGEIPEGWQTRNLGCLLELVYGKSLPASKRRHGKIAVYGSGGQIGMHDTALLNGPSVIVGRKGTVGSVYWEDGPNFPIDTVYYVVPRIGSLLFSYHLLISLPLHEMSTDTAVPGLNRNNAYQVGVALPSSDLLSTFETVVGTLWKKRALNLKLSEILLQSRDLLLPALISGRIRFKDIKKVS